MSENRERKKLLGQKIRIQYRRQRRKAILSLVCAILTGAFVISMVLLEIMPQTYKVNVGEAASETIYAIADVEDTVATENAKKAAQDAVAEVYKADEAKTNQAVSYFENTVFKGLETASKYGDGIRDGRENTGGYIVQYDLKKQEELLKNELSFLSDSSDMLKEGAMTKTEKVVKILDSNPKDVAKLKEWFIPTLRAWLKDGVSENELSSKKEVMARTVENYEGIGNASLKTVLAEVFLEKAEANSVLDTVNTENAKKQAIESVEAVMIPRGTAIVTQDTIVTQAQYDMLNRLGMLEDGDFAYNLIIGSVGLVAVLLFIVAAYVVIFEKKTAAQPKKVLLLCILIAVNVLIAILLKSAGWQKMMNAAISTVLVAVLFSEQLAIIVNVALSVILAMFVSDEAGVFTTEAVAIMLSSLAGGIGGIYVCKKVRNTSSRAKTLLPGACAGLIGMVCVFAVMWSAGKNIEISIKSAVYALAGGVIAALFSVGSLSVWESMFGLITQSKLLELSSSSSDLLRKLSLEIPGTYQHSSTVAELAENGAKDIGADPMLAKVGALYHDIGKLRCPECYTENQTDESKGFHDTLSPRESAKIIFSHITEGVQIAKANKLPREIIDIIKEHHGTSAVMYFYNKARQTEENVKIDEFRYQGPNPQTKESGIIMLADCIEASVRSMDEKTHESIKAQIERMFKARMDDGELDHSELTLRDINVLKTSFLNTLTAVYHTRIKYDNQEKKTDDGNN